MLFANILHNCYSNKYMMQLFRRGSRVCRTDGRTDRTVFSNSAFCAS